MREPSGGVWVGHRRVFSALYVSFALNGLDGPRVRESVPLLSRGAVTSTKSENVTPEVGLHTGAHFGWPLSSLRDCASVTTLFGHV